MTVWYTGWNEEWQVPGVA